MFKKNYSKNCDITAGIAIMTHYITFEWKENVESKGMRVNMNKTKVMISAERQMVRQKAARWPCGVCNKGVGSNSLQCT